MIAAMNDLGYDAVNLGNHEFSHGLPFLRHSAKDARFPIVQILPLMICPSRANPCCWSVAALMDRAKITF